MVSTVQSLNSVRIVLCMRSSVSRSTAAVASSSTRILDFLNRALARHTNWRWPTLQRECERKNGCDQVRVSKQVSEPASKWVSECVCKQADKWVSEEWETDRQKENKINYCGTTFYCYKIIIGLEVFWNTDKASTLSHLWRSFWHNSTLALHGYRLISYSKHLLVCPDHCLEDGLAYQTANTVRAVWVSLYGCPFSSPEVLAILSALVLQRFSQSQNKVFQVSLFQGCPYLAICVPVWWIQVEAQRSREQDRILRS